MTEQRCGPVTDESRTDADHVSSSAQRYRDGCIRARERRLRGGSKSSINESVERERFLMNLPSSEEDGSYVVSRDRS